MHMTKITFGEPREGRDPLAFAMAIIEVIAILAMIGVGLTAWYVGIVHRGYDYDEVLRAHSIWLTTQGLRPYSDFFECHPPYFILLSPVLRSLADPVDALKALRIVAGMGNLFFLGGLVAIGQAGLPKGFGKSWSWLSVAFVAFNPYILDFLVEFRVDGWGYAIVAWSLFRYLRSDRKNLRVLEFGFVTALGSALFCPKMVLLPPMIMLFDMITRFDTWRGFLRTGLVYSAGIAMATSAFLVYLLANGIGIERTSLLLGRYHAISNTHAGFRYGLLGQISTLRILLFPIVAGALVWGVDCLRQRRISTTYEPGLAIWLVMQMLLVTYPYKQYYAPWFLFATSFLIPLGRTVTGVLKHGRILIYLTACLLTVQGSAQIGQFWGRSQVSTSEDNFIRWMNKVTSPGDRVVGSHPFHPIDRLDTFFLSFNTSDPKGFDSERILAELPGLQTFVTADHYRAELKAHPPALVVIRSPLFEVTYPTAQRAIIEEYTLQNGYRAVRVGPALVSLRPDRYEFARRNGLLD